MLRPLLAVLIAIAFACPCSLPANEPSPATTHGDILADSLHPLDSKEAARARFAALQAPTSKLAEDKLGAAEYSLAARFGNFWAGRGTLDFLLGACLHYAEAAGALAPDGPGQAAIHETVWSLATIVEEINTFRYVAGRIPIQDLAQTTAFRLQAQRFLRRSWVPLVQQGTRARWLLDVERIFDEASYPFPEKALAKAKFQATQTSEQELLQGMQAAARAEQVERFREFHAGRGTLDFLLESAVRSAQARLAASTSPGERLVALETLWNACREIERVNRFRFEAGRIPVQDYAESQYHRRHAEVLVRAVRAKTDQSKATPLIPESDLPWRYDRHETNYLKDYAKDR
ncbi:MAG: hypothetical protein JNM56_36100, partial [Planctomycetia bacterium]|nr:hypothetical protein [Planctomycetia bacterium]